jgi:HAD superfamily hydrolase (TIGR01484 family)
MKILVSDFDKTFYRDNYYKNIKYVNKFVEDGNIFVIATGRNITSLLSDIGNFPVNYEYLICNDGGMIYNKKLEIIKRRDIDPSVVDEVCKMLEKSDSIGSIFIDNGNTLVENRNTLVNGIIVRYIDYDNANKLLDKIVQLYPEVHGYLSENWLNITNYEVNKGSAIDYLTDIFSWNKDDIYVAGDNINDISMFERYNGYAMADGHDDLKKVSYEVVNEFKNILDLLNKKKD